MQRSSHAVPRLRSSLLLVAAGTALVASPGAVPVVAAPPSALTEFLGVWRGSSVCVDRVIAPACRDETVIYEVRRAAKAETATVKADKVVHGERLTMGEFDFTYSLAEACWRTEFETPRFHGAWCLVLEGKRMTGTLRQLPDKAVVRRVELTRDEAPPASGKP